MTQLPIRKQRDYFQRDQKRRAKARTKIKRMVYKIVRENPGKLTTAKIVYAVHGKVYGDKSMPVALETFISGVVWSMKDCGELDWDEDMNFIIGPRAPKLRKK